MEVRLQTEPTSDGMQRQLFKDGTLRLFAQRCSESVAQNSPNQDYTALQTNSDETCITFCVCDGVGSSYHGESAAHSLAHNLCAWLLQLSAKRLASRTIAAQLKEQLVAWAPLAQQRLHAYDDDHAAMLPLLREVLAELRENTGSETVFFAGRIDRDTQARQSQAFFCWMGNVAAQIITPREAIALGQDDDYDRWSTRRGPRGAIHHRSFTRSDLCRVVVATDGIASKRNMVASFDDAALQQCAQTLLETPTSDDITLLDIHYKS